MSPDTFITCGGVASVSRNLIESHSPRVLEALVGSLLFLLVHPKSRKAANIDLTVLSAPYCDIHYQHHGWTSGEKNKEERDSRISSTHTALLSVLHSFPGLVHFCDPMEVSSGLKSLVDVLRFQHLEARKAVMDLFNDLLGVPNISWTDEAGVALLDVDPSKMQDSWKLPEGFVAMEGKSILPHLSVFRPNLVEVHKALLLQTFIKANLLEALIEVIVTSDSFISLRAAILLGEGILIYNVSQLLKYFIQFRTNFAIESNFAANWVCPAKSSDLDGLRQRFELSIISAAGALSSQHHFKTERYA